MKKIILEYNTSYQDYVLNKKFVTTIDKLHYLSAALDPLEDSSIVCEEIDREGKTEIFSRDSIKEEFFIEFEDFQKSVEHSTRYYQYYDKRWAEMPKIVMSIPDWHELQKQWEKIKEEKPKYVIFELDDSGPLDKVKVYGKQELSEQDLDYIKEEHEKFLKYEKAKQTYIDNHPDYSYVWRGPQDDEYEADIMRYYDDKS